MTDWIPGISQLKSGFQLICGNPKGAWETQKNFVKKCPGVSHVVGGVVYTVGAIADDDEAKNYGKEALIGGTRTLSDVADGFPLLGHLKGGIHHLVGDEEGGNRALISATRSSVVMTSGAVGFVVGGPVGAICAGAGSGVTFDGVHTLSEANKDGPHGVWALGSRHTSGDIFDTVVGVASDACTGYNGGKFLDKSWRSREIRSFERILKKRKALKLNDSVAGTEVWSEVTDQKTGKTYYGNNKNIRKKTKLTQPRDPKPNLFIENNPVEGELPINREAQTCAETHAYHQLLKDRPDANLSADTQVNTFAFKNGKWKNMTRCDNCMTRSDVMGKVPSDPLVIMFFFSVYNVNVKLIAFC